MNQQIVWWLEATFAGMGCGAMLYVMVEGWRTARRRRAIEAQLQKDLAESRVRMEEMLTRRFAGTWHCETCGTEMKVKRIELDATPPEGHA